MIVFPLKVQTTGHGYSDSGVPKMGRARTPLRVGGRGGGAEGVVYFLMETGVKGSITGINRNFYLSLYTDFPLQFFLHFAFCTLDVGLFPLLLSLYLFCTACLYLT